MAKRKRIEIRLIAMYQEKTKLLWRQWEGPSGRFYCVHIITSIVLFSFNMADVSESPSKEYYFTLIPWHWTKETVSEKHGVLQLLESFKYCWSLMLLVYNNGEDRKIWCYIIHEINQDSHLQIPDLHFKSL